MRALLVRRTTSAAMRRPVSWRQRLESARYLELCTSSAACLPCSNHPTHSLQHAFMFMFLCPAASPPLCCFTEGLRWVLADGAPGDGVGA